MTVQNWNKLLDGELGSDLAHHLRDEGEIEMSSRKPFNDRAGYVASRINPLTGISNVIYIASEQGIEADKKYVTVCEAHHTMVSSSSIPTARVDMKDASKWCETCQHLLEREEAVATRRWQ